MFLKHWPDTLNLENKISSHLLRISSIRITDSRVLRIRKWSTPQFNDILRWIERISDRTSIEFGLLLKLLLQLLFENAFRDVFMLSYTVHPLARINFATNFLPNGTINSIHYSVAPMSTTGLMRLKWLRYRTAIRRQFFHRLRIERGKTIFTTSWRLENEGQKTKIVSSFSLVKPRKIHGDSRWRHESTEISSPTTSSEFLFSENQVPWKSDFFLSIFLFSSIFFWQF